MSTYRHIIRLKMTSLPRIEFILEVAVLAPCCVSSIITHDMHASLDPVLISNIAGPYFEFVLG